MNEYSRAFSDAFFVKWPEWKNNAKVETEPELSHDSYLVLEVFSPSEARTMLIVTTDNQEITIGFGMWHSHFSNRDEAFLFIEDILSEKKVVIIFYKDGNWGGSTSCTPEEIERELSEYPLCDRYEVRSWKGTYDKSFIKEN